MITKYKKTLEYSPNIKAKKYKIYPTIHIFHIENNLVTPSSEYFIVRNDFTRGIHYTLAIMKEDISNIIDKCYIDTHNP